MTRETLVFVDLETTGLDPRKHEIVEMGVVVVDARTMEVLVEIDEKIRPDRPEDGDPKAYEVNGYNAEDWKEAATLWMAMRLLSTVGRGGRFVAHNMIFDWSFLEEASRKTGLPLDFDRHRVDIFTLAWGKIPHDRMQSWSLKTICTYLRLLPEPKVHRAINGARCAYNAYKALMKM